MEPLPRSGSRTGDSAAAPSHSTVRRRPLPVRLALAFGLFAAGLIIGLGAMYFWIQQPALEAAHSHVRRAEIGLATLRGQLDDAETAAAALEARLLVEESTRRSLETTLGTFQAELGQARDTLAFYEQLMPPGPEGAISIRALDVERSGPHLKYRMLLMRSPAQGAEPFQGRVQFMASGRLNGEEHEVPLSPAVVAGAPVPEAGEAPEDANGLALEFSEFQRSSGLLGLPEGFEPDAITVNVLEGRTLRVTRSVPVATQD